MNNKFYLLGATLCLLTLNGCHHFYSNETTSSGKPAIKKADSSIQLYPDGYDNGGAYAPDDAKTEQKQIVFPNGSDPLASTTAQTAAPSFKEHDKSWVGKQNPQGYTVEIANSDNPADVAGALHQAPKNEKTAEIKYHKDGKQYYKGVYGSYPTYEAAQQALNALPDQVKQKAVVKTWGNVQNAGQ